MSKKEITLREHLRRIGRLGGKASMEAMTEDERKAFHQEGGKVGGRARAEALTSKERSAIARKAAEARWGKKTTTKKAAKKRKK